MAGAATPCHGAGAAPRHGIVAPSWRHDTMSRRRNRFVTVPQRHIQDGRGTTLFGHWGGGGGQPKAKQ